MPGSLIEAATERLLHPRRRLLDDPTASQMPISGRDRTTQELVERRVELTAPFRRYVLRDRAPNDAAVTSGVGGTSEIKWSPSVPVRRLDA
jgi:hypothetical protein